MKISIDWLKKKHVPLGMGIWILNYSSKNYSSKNYSIDSNFLLNAAINEDEAGYLYWLIDALDYEIYERFGCECNYAGLNDIIKDSTLIGAIHCDMLINYLEGLGVNKL